MYILDSPVDYCNTRVKILEIQILVFQGNNIQIIQFVTLWTPYENHLQLNCIYSGQITM